MNSKQRAYLRGLANGLTPIFQVGKNGISDNLIKQIDDALEARELIKLNVLETSPDDTLEVANALAEATNSILVQTVGDKITLYRARKKDSKIVLPK
ncbi:MAG: ribosome assembly RNA-binding protein YhbY [Clostridia bacterium]